MDVAPTTTYTERENSIDKIVTKLDKIDNKLIFVTFVCSFTFIMLTILIFYQLDAKIDYILEWNYFLILLLFYFLSFLMWKKI